MSKRPQFPQHLFGVYEATILEVFLRSSQCSMEEGTVFRIEPVSRIEEKEIDLSSFREFRRFVQHEPAVVNAGFESHGKRIARRCRQAFLRRKALLGSLRRTSLRTLRATATARRAAAREICSQPG